MKTTKGPWHIDTVRGYTRIKADTHEVNSVAIIPKGQHDGNVKLIAAAPDLYWAIVELLNLPKEELACIRTDVLAKLRKAASKVGLND